MSFFSCLFGEQTQLTESSAKHYKCKCLQHHQTIQKNSLSQISRHQEVEQIKSTTLIPKVQAEQIIQSSQSLIFRHDEVKQIKSTTLIPKVQAEQIIQSSQSLIFRHDEVKQIKSTTLTPKVQVEQILSRSSRSTPKTLLLSNSKKNAIFNKIKRFQSPQKNLIQKQYTHNSEHKNVYTRLYEAKLVTAQQILKSKQIKQKKQRQFINKIKNLKEEKLKGNQNKQNVMSIKRYYFFRQVSKLKAKLQSSAIETTNEQFQFLKMKFNFSYQKESEKQLKDILIVYANFKNWDSNNRFLQQNLNKSSFNQDFLLHWQFLKNQHQKIWGKLIFFHNLMRIPKQFNRNDQLPKKIGLKLDKILIQHKRIKRNDYKEPPSLLPYKQKCVQKDKKPDQAPTYSLKKSLYNTWLLIKSQRTSQEKIINTPTPWICQITSDGRYIWRSNRAVEANDTRILLQFLFFNEYNQQKNNKTTENSDEDGDVQIIYPFVHINTGIHGEPSVKSAIKLKNSSFLDPRITMQTCLVIFAVFQKYIEEDFKELANIYNTKININNATLKSGLTYPNTDHIIDTHSFGGNYYLKIGNQTLNFWYIDPNINTPQNEQELSKRQQEMQIQII